MGRALGDGWQPFVRVYSRRSGERTYIYAKQSGKDVQLMMATIEAREAVVMQVKLNPDTLAKWMEKPDQMGGILNARRNHRANESSPAATAQATESSAASAPTFAGSEASKPGDTAGAAPARPQLKTEEQTSALLTSEAPPPVVALGTVPALEPASLRLNTRLINLNTKVTDADGRLVLDLKREDFEVYEDGVKQDVSHFAPVTAPVSLVLLLDLSASMKSKEREIKRAAKKFVASLGPQDRIAVATFTRRFHLVCDFTSDRKALNRRIDSIKNHDGGTGYYDAMWSSLDLLKRAPDARKAIVVLTDGVDSSLESPRSFKPDHPFNDLLARMAEDDVTVYPMYMDTEYDMVVKKRRDKARSYATAREQLRAAAEQTGGVMFRVNRDEDLAGVYERVANELRTLYSLAYSSSNEDARGQWRNVKVKTSRAGLLAQTKRGYYAK
jgi:Ca-activated chloride channel family protein